MCAAPQDHQDVFRLEYRSKLLNPKWAKVCARNPKQAKVCAATQDLQDVVRLEYRGKLLNFKWAKVCVISY